jgi:hypothetical protein
MSEIYLRPVEAATYLKTSPSTLAKFRVYGGGPAFCKLGRAVRYRTADLDAFMLLNRLESTSECSAPERKC